MNHYYANNEKIRSDQKEIHYTYKGKTISYVVDVGIFSKERVDYGTNVLINALEEFKENVSILDMGCGYGAIGIAIAKAYPKTKVDMVDINLRAIKLSQMNADANKIKNASIFESNLYQNITQKYDYIISNPPIRAGKEIVHGVISGGYPFLKKDGKVIVVIQKKQGAPSLEKKMVEVFGNVRTLNKENGYYVFESVKKE